MADLWAQVLAAATRIAAERDAQAHERFSERRAHFNSPGARAARSAAARKAAATRKANKEAVQRAEAEEERLEAERYARIPDGPLCDAMNVVMDAREVFCIREPHTDGDCEDIDGHTWSYEKD